MLLQSIFNQTIRLINVIKLSTEFSKGKTDKDGGFDYWNIRQRGRNSKSGCRCLRALTKTVLQMFMQNCFRWKILIAVRASRLNPHKTNKNIIIQLLRIITFLMADVIIKNLRQWVRFVMLIVFFKLGLISVGRGGPRRRNTDFPKTL